MIKLPSITNSIEMNVSKELQKPLCFNITLDYIAKTKDNQRKWKSDNMLAMLRVVIGDLLRITFDRY